MLAEIKSVFLCPILTASSLTQVSDAMFANDHKLVFKKSSRSSSKSWNLSQAAFHSRFHRPVVSSRILIAASYSLLLLLIWICVFSSFALFFLSSWPMTM